MKRRSVLLGAGALATGTMLTRTGMRSTANDDPRPERPDRASGPDGPAMLTPNNDLLTREDGERLAFSEERLSDRFERQGLNPRSTTTFSNVFEIRTHQVTGEIACYVVPSDFDVDVVLTAGAATTHVDEGESLSDPGDPIRLQPDESVPVDITVSVDAFERATDDGTFLLRTAGER